MNDDRLEQNRIIIGRWSKVLSVMLLSTLLVVFLLCELDQKTRARPTRQQGENLVPNPGFEIPDPASWDNSGSFWFFWWCAWSGSISHGGDYSAEMGNNVSWHTGQWWSDFFAVEADRQYDFSGWIRANDLSDKADLTLAFYSSPSQGDLIAEFHSSSVTGSSDWTEVAGSAVAPGGAQYARIYCELEEEGTVWFDDIFVGLAHTEKPILVIGKDSPDSVEPGQRLDYVVNYSNIGNITATQVTITETYDVNVNFNFASPPPEIGSGNRVWEIGALGPGESGSIGIAVIVTSPLTNDLILQNLVEMDCAETAPVSGTTTTMVTSWPDLNISKSGNPNPVEPGGTLVYTITYGNGGTAVATGVDITDTLPLSASYESANPAPTYSVTNTLAWENLGDLDIGTDGTIIVTTTVSSSAHRGDSLRNHVLIACDQAVQADYVEYTTIRPYLISIAPEQLSNTALPDQKMCYSHTVYLTGTQPYTIFIAAVSSRGWETDVAPSSVYLEPGDSAEVQACVNVPDACAAISGTVDALTVTAGLVDGPTETDIAENATMVAQILSKIPVTPVRGLQFTSGPHLEMFTFAHDITNTGNYTDQFELKIQDTNCSVVQIDPDSQVVGPCGVFPVGMHIVVSDIITGCEAVFMVSSQSFPDVITRFADEVGPPKLIYLPLVMRDFCVFCNGGFETGDFTCWAHGGGLAQSVQSEIVYEGKHAALLGSPDYPCRDVPKDTEAWMKQTFTVPSCPNLMLSFKYRIFSHDKLTGDKWDSFDVYINNNLVLRDGSPGPADCDSPPWDSGWLDGSFGLGTYEGNIEVSFHNVSREDKYYNTWTYVDQVEVTCGD